MVPPLKFVSWTFQFFTPNHLATDLIQLYLNSEQYAQLKKYLKPHLVYYFSINIYPKDDQKKYIVRKQPINMKDYEEKIPVYMIIAILEKTIGTIWNKWLECKIA